MRPDEHADKVRQALSDLRPGIRVMSVGDIIEIYKEVGLPKDVAERFELAEMSGSHGIGHTRMATESAVTTLGAHPFSTGPDQVQALKSRGAGTGSNCWAHAEPTQTKDVRK